MHDLTEDNIRIHLEMFAGYTDRSVHGVDMDVMRALSKLSQERDEAVKERDALREAVNRTTGYLEWLDRHGDNHAGDLADALYSLEVK